MFSLKLIEYQNFANELNINFIACDNTLLNWYYPSKSFLGLFDLGEEELKINPKIWMDRIEADNMRNFIEKAGSLAENVISENFEFVFRAISKGFHLKTIRIHFFKPNDKTNGRYFICAAEDITSVSRLKFEAAKAKDREIETSARIQKALLSAQFYIDNSDMEIAAETLPSNKVDGDFYEFISLSQSSMDFIIGDVMGKGIAAALLAAGVKSAFYKQLINRITTNNKLPDIINLIQDIEQTLGRELIRLEKFLTLYYCRISIDKPALRFIDAGHTSFIYFDSGDGSCWTVKGSNMPIGFIRAQDYKKYILPLKRNDILFFYSDGISDIENSENVRFGQERIRQMISAHSGLKMSELIKKIFNVCFFFAAEEFKDDMTAAAIKIKKCAAKKKYAYKQYHFDNVKDVDLPSARSEFDGDLKNSYKSQAEETLTKITIAFIEIIANSMAYTKESVGISWELGEDSCALSIVFYSDDFEWYKASVPRIAEYQQSGFGFYLVSQGVDSLLLLQGPENKKKIVMVKEFP